MTDVPGNPYLDPDSGVLRNKYGFTDAPMLALQVRLHANLAEQQLRQHETPVRFNGDYLRAMHRELFKRSYDWAGQLRTRELGIGENTAAPAAELATRLDVLSGQLRREGELRRLTDGRQWADRAAYYWGELNRCHPFPDGNGRSTRMFLHQLAKAAGHQLNWQAAVSWLWSGQSTQDSPGEHAVDAASKAAFDGNYEPMRALLQYAVTGSADRASAPRADLDALDRTLRNELDAATRARPDRADIPDLLGRPGQVHTQLTALRDRYPRPEAQPDRRPRTGRWRHLLRRGDRDRNSGEADRRRTHRDAKGAEGKR